MIQSLVSIFVGSVVCLGAFLEPTLAAAQRGFPLVVAKKNIPANTKLGADHVELQTWPADRTPVDSFADPVQVIGKYLKQDLTVGDAVLRRQVSETRVAAPATTELTQLEIPVPANIDYIVGQKVDFVRVFNGGERRTVVQNIGIVGINAVDRATVNDPIPLRTVSIRLSTQQAALIGQSLKSRQGTFELKPVDNSIVQENEDTQGRATVERGDQESQQRPNLIEEYNQQMARSKQQQPGRATTQPSAMSGTTQVPQNPSRAGQASDDLALQLRAVAESFESMAARLEYEQKYEQADLIREGIQKFREAARIK